MSYSLLFGHVSRDLTPEGDQLGGAVVFSGLTWKAMGLSPRIVTSAPPDMDDLLGKLGKIRLLNVPTDTATSFENKYTLAGRTQRLAGRASFLTLDAVPPYMRRQRRVLLAPIADEVDPMLARSFPDAEVFVTPQGWMRKWDDHGNVSFKPWADAERVLPYVDAVSMSIEDVQGDEAMVAEFARQTKVLAVTRGGDGCTIFVNGEPNDVPAPAVSVVDPTGAGDIFAAVFFGMLRIMNDPIETARIACVAASDSVTRLGLESIPHLTVIKEARAGKLAS